MRSRPPCSLSFMGKNTPSAASADCSRRRRLRACADLERGSSIVLGRQIASGRCSDADANENSRSESMANQEIDLFIRTLNYDPRIILAVAPDGDTTTVPMTTE